MKAFGWFFLWRTAFSFKSRGKFRGKKKENEALVSPVMVSAQSAVKDMTPKWHQINIVHFRALFLIWHLFQRNVLSVTPSARTSPPLTYTPVCESVCEEQFRNLPGNQSTDLYLLLYPSTAAPAAGGCGEERTDENRASPRQGDILYAGQKRWSKCADVVEVPKT